MRTLRWLAPTAVALAAIERQTRRRPQPNKPLADSLQDSVAILRDLSLGQQLLAEIDSLAASDPWPNRFDQLRELFVSTSLGRAASHLPPVDKSATLV